MVGGDIAPGGASGALVMPGRFGTSTPEARGAGGIDVAPCVLEAGSAGAWAAARTGWPTAEGECAGGTTIEGGVNERGGGIAGGGNEPMLEAAVGRGAPGAVAAGRLPLVSAGAEPAVCPG